jgi:cytochrome c553
LIHWKHIAITLAVLPFVAVLVAWIGFFNVGASTGHWKITEWFLHFAMRSAVRTYALAVEEPERLPVEGIQPAAGHYERGCAICHGAPGQPRSPTVLRMLPQPPDLATVVDEWSDAQLFRIVKHGVRFTGMPAWPTQDRDDEVWAMVAFLREYRRLDEREYRRLAGTDGSQSPQAPASGQGIPPGLGDCIRCHGADGGGRTPLVPVLAGQNDAYLLASLRAFAEGQRASGVMQVPAVAAKNLEALAAHFAALPPVRPEQQRADPALVERGASIARTGLAAAGVPACLGCHGEANDNPRYPTIRGQPAAYIETQLRLFREAKRGGTPFHHLMNNAAKGLSDADIAALAAYFSQAATEATPSR